MKACISLLLTAFNLILLINQSSCNDFSSFLTANASLAVIVDDVYAAKKNISIIAQLRKIIEDISRETLKNGGLNVKYYTWNSVRLKKDFIAAITVTDCANTWRFFDTAETNSILLLAVTEAECPRLPDHKAIMIPLVNRGAEIPQMILDIRVQKILKWDSSAIIFDNSIDESSTQILKSLVKENTKNKLKPMSIFIYQVAKKIKNVDRSKSIEKALIRFKNRKYNRFVVLLSYVEDILEIGQKLRMFNVYNQWLFLLPSEKYRNQLLTLASDISEGANVAFAVNTTVPECQESILCSVTEIATAFISALSNVIIEEGALYGQISDEEWEAIRLTKGERQIEILNYIKKYLAKRSSCSGCAKWSFKSMLTWGEKRYQHISESLTVDTGYGINFIHSGDWSPIFGFDERDVLFPHFQQKFRNMTLNVITYHNPPWQIIDKDENNNIIHQSGIVIEILKEISAKLNFSYNLIDISDDPAKTELEKDRKALQLSGSLTNLIEPSMMENLTSQKYFLVAIGTTIFKHLGYTFNYTVPISIQTYTFMTKKPDEVNRIYLFAAPFTTQTWISLIVAIVITAPVLCFINKYEPLMELRTKGLCKMKNCYWYIYGALLQQGGLYLPKSDSGRVLIGVWWTVVIVLVTTYCGNLVAFLTFPKFQVGFNFLSEAFSQKDVVTFGLRNKTFFGQYAKQSTRNDFKKFMGEVTLYEDLKGEDITAVQQGQRINIDWKINLQLAIQKHYDASKKCTLVLGKEDFVDEQIALIVPKESPYLDLINEEITLLLQMGFVQRWHQKYLPSADKCNLKSLARQISNHKVNLDDMQGCFIILIFGFAIAFCVMACELWLNYRAVSKTTTYVE